MAKSIENSSAAALQDVPLITHGTLSRAFKVGLGATRASAERLGIKGERMPNGRDYLTFKQAQAIAQEILAR